MRRVYHRYLISVVTCLGCPMLAILAINLFADPYRAYRIADIESLSSYRQGEYVSAAEAFRHDRPETVFVGSSRVLDGFDGRSLRVAGRPISRVAVRGTSWAEQSQILRHIVASKHPPKLVLFGMDLDTILRSKRPSDFEQSRFSGSYRPIDYHSQNLVSLSALRQSIELMRDWYQGAPISPEIERMVADRGSLDVFRSQLNRDIPMCLPSDAVAALGPAMLELGKIIESAQIRQIEFRVVVLPVHALSYEKLNRQGFGNYIEEFKRSLVVCCDRRSVPVWDFTGYSDIAMEPVPMSEPMSNPPRFTMKWFYDSDHFTPNFGELILAQMLETDDRNARVDIGRRIHLQNIEQHLASTRDARSRYLGNQPKELDLIARVTMTPQLSANST